MTETGSGNTPPEETPAQPEGMPEEARIPPSASTREATGELTKSADERKAILDRTLADRGAILTAGLWAIVWIILALTGGIKRHLITVDEYGNVVDQKI